MTAITKQLSSSNQVPHISDKDFETIRVYLQTTSGIELTPSKKSLVTSRLWRRLRHYNFNCFSQYVDLLNDGAHVAERQLMLDSLTTNETYFFREADHFEYLEREILQKYRGAETFRVWSAASSSGEEAFSIAMMLAETLGMRPWEVLGTDISRGVLEKARSGHYTMNRISGIPQECLHRYCLQGTGPQAGTMLINDRLRRQVKFQYANLNDTLPDVGLFDVIFLRNVLIYFSEETCREIVSRVLAKLKPGGTFFIGHSETLTGITDRVERVAPTTYIKQIRKPHNVHK
jgi:chemotaxis protein methyltransferase CheR